MKTKRKCWTTLGNCRLEWNHTIIRSLWRLFGHRLRLGNERSSVINPDLSKLSFRVWSPFPFGGEEKQETLWGEDQVNRTDLFQGQIMPRGRKEWKRKGKKEKRRASTCFISLSIAIHFYFHNNYKRKECSSIGPVQCNCFFPFQSSPHPDL